MIIAFDLDDTLCTRPRNVEHLGTPEKYRYCEPIYSVIDRLNKLHREGHTVYIYTSRGMTSLGGDIKLIESTLREVTEQKLQEWGVEYDFLVFGKIHFDLLVDDKAMSLQEFKDNENI